jgi:hypothetical protein
VDYNQEIKKIQKETFTKQQEVLKRQQETDEMLKEITRKNKENRQILDSLLSVEELKEILEDIKRRNGKLTS